MDLLANSSSLSASLFHSMCESFSSRDMAEECLRQQEEQAEEQQQEAEKNRASQFREDEAVIKGVETLAQAIESIAMRVKLRLTNTTFRVEYMPTREHRGLAVELKVGLVMYSGEFGMDKEKKEDVEPASADGVIRDKNVKKIYFEDVSFYTDEFSFASAASRHEFCQISSL
jgi:hypothetical protein